MPIIYYHRINILYFEFDFAIKTFSFLNIILNYFYKMCFFSFFSQALRSNNMTKAIQLLQCALAHHVQGCFFLF